MFGRPSSLGLRVAPHPEMKFCGWEPTHPQQRAEGHEGQSIKAIGAKDLPLSRGPTVQSPYTVHVVPLPSVDRGQRLLRGHKSVLLRDQFVSIELLPANIVIL